MYLWFASLYYLFCIQWFQLFPIRECLYSFKCICLFVNKQVLSIYLLCVKDSHIQKPMWPSHCSAWILIPRKGNGHGEREGYQDVLNAEMLCARVQRGQMRRVVSTPRRAREGSMWMNEGLVTGQRGRADANIGSKRMKPGAVTQSVLLGTRGWHGGLLWAETWGMAKGRQGRGVGLLTLHLGYPSQALRWQGMEGGELLIVSGLCLRAGFSDCLWSRTAGLQHCRRRGRQREASRMVHPAHHGAVTAQKPSRF